MKFTPEDRRSYTGGRARPTTDGVLVDGAVIEEQRRVEAILTDDEPIRSSGRRSRPRTCPKLVASLDSKVGGGRERRGGLALRRKGGTSVPSFCFLPTSMPEEAD